MHTDQVRVDGYTVLPSVFDPALLARIDADAPENAPYPEIIEHPVLLSAVRAILGDDPVGCALSVRAGRLHPPLVPPDRCPPAPADAVTVRHAYG